MQLVQTITQQREILHSWIDTPLKNAAAACADAWSSSGNPFDALHSALGDIPQYALCYLISPDGTIITPAIGPNGVDHQYVGRDISKRPYFMEWDGQQEFLLSRLYRSDGTSLPCITALQAIRVDGESVAVIAIDFDNSETGYREQPLSRHHTQINGDPSIRQQLFMQTRTISPMEQQIDRINRLLEQLFVERGLFQVQLKYSSSTTTIRFNDRPYHDQLLTLEQLLDQGYISTLKRQPYSSMATVPKGQIMAVLELFKSLRLADENAYLRCGSLNIVTGMVELNFSCDGTHHLPVTEFLEKNISFWVNDSGQYSPIRSSAPIGQQPPMQGAA